MDSISKDFWLIDLSLFMYTFAASESWFEDEYFEIPDSGLEAKEFIP